MPFKYLNQIIYNEDASLKDVLSDLGKWAEFLDNKGFGIIVDDDGKCKGVLTDGDVRRKVLKNVDLETPVKNVMNKDFIYVSVNDNYHHILRQFDKDITILPVIDLNGKLVDLYKYSEFVVSARNDLRIIRARVPCRVSFSGGGTDMSSYINKTPTSVLSATINKYCTCSIIVGKDNKIYISSKDLNLKYTAENYNDIELGDDLDLIKSSVKIMQPNFGFELETHAEFAPGTGLGGSSAVVVSVLGALNYFRNEQQLDIYQLADLAYQVERIDMRIKGGWQDQYATAFGGFSWINFRKNEIIVNPLLLRKETILELEYNLMLFRLGETRSSSEIQKSHISKIEKNSTNLDSFSEMTELSVKMKESLLKGEIKSFADFLHESWIIKQKINSSVSNDLVEECYNTARELGALGGKLLGAGGSGYLLIYSSPLYQKKIIEALAKKGVTQEIFKFSQDGLEVWSTKK